MKLNKPQQTAVETDSKRVLVIAGPGTGKTRVMVNRVGRLISEGVSGYSILMLTFTNKAAREMKERIGKLVPEREARKLTIGTFHSVSLRILRDYGELLGYKPGITVYDDLDQKDIIGMLIKENSLKISVGKALNLLGAYYSNVDCFVSTPEDTAEFHDIQYLMTKYTRFLKENNALDFGMILVETRRLLTDFPDVRGHYKNLFTHTMVDEYQDTDWTQYSLHRLINSESLFCVGDPDQAIYGWRGASIKIILDFQKAHPGAETIILDQNYRSTKPIVEAANNVISHNQDRYKTTQWTDRKGEKICLKRIVADAYQISEIINNLEKHCGYNHKDIAVLSRGHALLEDTKTELQQREIPCLHVGGNRGIFEDPSIRQFIRLLRVINNPVDDFSCRLSVNWPEHRFSESEIRQFELDCVKEDTLLIEELAKWNGFFNWLLSQIEKEEFKLASARFIAAELAAKISFDHGVLDYYISEWLSLEEGTGLSDFLNHLSTKSVQDQIKKDVDKVVLSTIHAAKGLEWPVVIIIGVEEGKLPVTRKTSDIEEERRLMFVAMTRPQDLLYVTWRNQDVPKWGKQIKMVEKSRFIGEID